MAYKPYSKTEASCLIPDNPQLESSSSGDKIFAIRLSGNAARWYEKILLESVQDIEMSFFLINVIQLFALNVSVSCPESLSEAGELGLRSYDS